MRKPWLRFSSCTILLSTMIINFKCYNNLCMYAVPSFRSSGSFTLFVGPYGTMNIVSGNKILLKRIRMLMLKGSRTITKWNNAHSHSHYFLEEPPPYLCHQNPPRSTKLRKIINKLYQPPCPGLPYRKKCLALNRDRCRPPSHIHIASLPKNQKEEE